ncbi:MAG: hypothetical protein ABW221_08455 [Vicinamibacteria bacterium]
MKVTRDVIVDLWPVYEAGDASADTRALVEEFLSGDPALARELREGEEAMSELLFPESVMLSPDAEKSAFDRMRELTRLRTYFFMLSVLMVVASGMLRQFRFFSFLMAAGAGIVCAGLWLAETRPRLAALAIGPLVETRRQRRLRHARSACILVSFVLLVFSAMTRLGNDVPLLVLSVLGIVAWGVLSLLGRRRS